VANKSIIPEILQKHEAEILTEWIGLLKGGRGKTGRLKEGELETQAHDVLGALRTATEGGVDNDVTGERYGALREILNRISRSRARLTGRDRCGARQRGRKDERVRARAARKRRPLR